MIRGFRRPSEVRILEQMALGTLAHGISSRNLALHVLRLRPLVDREKPLDDSDFGRCMQLYHAAPPRLQRKMRPILDEWARGIRTYWRERIEDNRRHGYRSGPWLTRQVTVEADYSKREK